MLDIFFNIPNNHAARVACPAVFLLTHGLVERFLENHDERMAEEQRFLRGKAEEKYRRTHDFNLITGTYYDKKKEQDFVTSREKLGALQGRAQQHRLPPSIRYGEGNDYDIINKQVRHVFFLFSIHVFVHVVGPAAFRVQLRYPPHLLQQTQQKKHHACQSGGFHTCGSRQRDWQAAAPSLRC